MNKRNPLALEVVINTQADYLLPEGKAYLPKSQDIIVPGIKRLLHLNPENTFGVLTINNCFTEDEFERSELKKEFPPHCLVGDLGEYEPVGVQNLFSQYLMTPRGLQVYRLTKKQHSMWMPDMDDMQPTVQGTRGGALTAYSLNEFFGTVVDEALVSRVNVWGVDMEFAVMQAVAGFILRGYQVTIYGDLCASVTPYATVVAKYQEMFEGSFGSGQLRIASWLEERTALSKKPAL